MAMGPERSKPLHNFSLPHLKWGNQRFLRCVKVPTLDHPQKNQNDPFHNSKGKDNDIEAIREKLMIDLRVAAKKLQVSIFEEDTSANNATRPWNLRTRRAACKAPHRDQEAKFDSGSSPLKLGEAPVAPKGVENINERPRFSVSLSKEAVEEDFWALVGSRPPRRPKKRPRIVQRQLDTLFPGLWLSEVNAESYKVPDVPE